MEKNLIIIQTKLLNGEKSFKKEPREQKSSGINKKSLKSFM